MDPVIFLVLISMRLQFLSKGRVYLRVSCLSNADISLFAMVFASFSDPTFGGGSLGFTQFPRQVFCIDITRVLSLLCQGHSKLPMDLVKILYSFLWGYIFIVGTVYLKVFMSI